MVEYGSRVGNERSKSSASTSSLQSSLLAKGRAYSDTEDALSPEFYALSRRLSPNGAIFNLVSTIVGGGVLSIPYAFAHTGVVLGFFCVFASAAASGFSVYLLVAACRRTASEDYVSLAIKAFGPGCGKLVQMMLATLTWCCCVAYIVLAGQLIAEVLGSFYPHQMLLDVNRKYTKVAFTAACFPLCFFKQLRALRHTSVLSVASVAVLAVVIGYRSVQHGTGFMHPEKIKVWPSSAGDVMYALPLFIISYLCHFNVLPMHGELQQPTRVRIKRIIRYAMVTPAMLYATVGFLGYMYMLERTCDSILENMPTNDWLVHVGRIGLICTLLFSFPLLILPCRRAIKQIAFGVRASSDNSVEEDLSPREEGRTPSPVALSDLAASVSRKDSHPYFHTASTVLIVVTATITSLYVPGIAQVWTFMGATVGVGIAFILPSAIYIQLRGRHLDRWNARKIASWCVLATGIIAFALCTMEAAYHAKDKACPYPIHVVNISVAPTMAPQIANVPALPRANA